MIVTPGYIIFAGIALLAAISPGPDMLVVLKNALVRGRRQGISTSIGVGLAVGIHVTYTLIGIGVLISRSIVLFSYLKLLGAVYLASIALKLVFSKSERMTVLERSTESQSALMSCREGFLTNVLNPKATLFFVTIFSQFVSPELPLAAQVAYGVEAMVVIGGWFVVLSCIVSKQSIRQSLARWQHGIMRVMGVGLLYLSTKLAFER